ncbi:MULTISPECIES: type II toxin-antitoxin system Phd/YefM family antitoxin [unclassified Marinimicrobium]|uniref:type II toxin-antitoxin system Phd/YefM family antitoxin n=1 Tax=unclassified Marinimicrobium TaxID=2632100 RepID=UPI0004666B0E|nr:MULTISPECIES: type II toxin-antitoxin system prevent-host-death family antitoxin [unclassified Marinimicrobium]UZJ44344.1 type II toxin-antitoxin system prevent-host-death family antitoxin [Marinimicrobium sp. C6131]
MDIINFSAFREKLASFMDRVNDDHAPVIIRRSKNRSAVLMSLEDFQSYEETSYLLSTPANARALQTSLEEAERGDIVQRNLVE